jgi:Protein of unknown function (DUF4197)
LNIPPLAVGRTLATVALAIACVTAVWPTLASSLDALSAKETSSGLHAALDQGIDKAVERLGVPNGFLANPKVTIPLPPALDKADRYLRMVGVGADADALKAAMNHAAESAVAEAKPALKQALQRMTVEDAKGILTGGDDSATQYFRRATADSLTAKFKPVVARETAKVKLASIYDEYAGKAAAFGLIKGEDAHLDDYVTSKALDGLFAEIADEERAIRKDPLGQANSLIKRVFGAVP